MPFILNEEQKLFHQMISEFAKNEIQPIAAQIDRNEDAPIMKIADLAIVGDVHKIIPEMIARLES